MNTRARRDDLDHGNAFLPDPRKTGKATTRVSLAELFAEGYVSAATHGEDTFDTQRDQMTADELGGPFIEVDATEELALDDDPANPEDGTKEPFPTAIRSKEK